MPLDTLPPELLLMIFERCGKYSTLARAARVNKKLYAPATSVLYTLETTVGCDAIVHAASKGHLHVAEMLLSKKDRMDPDICRDRLQYNMNRALLKAVHKGHKEMVQLLVDHKAAPDEACDKNKISALYWLVRCLETPRFIPFPDLRQPTAENQAAFRTRIYEILEILLKAGANPDPRTPTARTPLHMAAKINEIELATLLIKWKASVNVREQYVWTPLHYAARLDRIDMAALFLKEGADIDAQEHRGYTPLMQAIMVQSNDLVQFLLRHKADVNRQAFTRERPLTFALRNHDEYLVSLLLSHGATPNFKGDAIQNPLHFASSSQDHGIVRSLLEYGATLEGLDRDGVTTLQLAVNLEDKGMMHYILCNDPDPECPRTFMYLPLEEYHTQPAFDLLWWKGVDGGRVAEIAQATHVAQAADGLEGLHL
ncbi:ankyrin [Penicillium argentinense]|uniref:Ankyrin n=1 Tax=Penicillium argentinense TaxID=1131581 RepID=A0A9W9FPM0_9EURO|nr:ankyrin [Penicillium argentinense]KAJ5104051.1 ankyrin [Penicillium argentinense]